MKIDRLLGILVMLSKTDKMTAPQLAERFEVSKRTINRDIETLCMAGIPIVTQQGAGGGISIHEGYKIDKNIFKDNELSDIITGLKALSSVGKKSEIDMLINKVVPHDDHDTIVKIELGSFYKGSISNKVQIIKQAIKQSKTVVFTYYSKRGKAQREAEPYNVIFKWDNWYLYGYAKGFRMYKLNRLWDINMTEKSFEVRKTEDDLESFDNIFDDNYHLKAVFKRDVEYLLVEEYGPKSYNIDSEGNINFEVDFTNYDYMLSWVLKYGNDIKVLEPKELIDDLKNIAQNTLEKYK